MYRVIAIKAERIDRTTNGIPIQQPRLWVGSESRGSVRYLIIKIGTIVPARRRMRDVRR
jgi:hypothetical protein